MTKIKAIVLVYNKFNINKAITILIPTLFINNSFICRYYRLINPIFFLESLLIIFSSELTVF